MEEKKTHHMVSTLIEVWNFFSTAFQIHAKKNREYARISD